MKILIPMAGKGKRFVRAGYLLPKPFIEVDGHPVIEHILRNFSPDDEFVFGMNEEHYREPAFRKTLQRLAPKAMIIPIPYQPEGPIAVLRHMFEAIDDDEPVIVNYCDFSWEWNYEDFRKTVAENRSDGAVVCYRGFHPHLLGPNHYATLDADGLWMKEIREKFSWHDDKQKDWTSSGTYYFRTGALLRKCVGDIEPRHEWRINGEYYVSQLFQILREQGGRVFIYEAPRMLQWGTPEDLEEYEYWSNYFRALARPPAPVRVHDMDVLILMAGAGKRFSDAGYTVPKPLIPVRGVPMVTASAECLPRGSRYLFAVRSDLPETPGVLPVIRKSFPEASFIDVPGLTQGQASTALLAKNELDPDRPLLIGACDHGILFDQEAFARMTGRSDTDALILTFRNFPPVRRNPKAYGWVETDAAGRAKKVSVKTPLEGDPVKNHAIIGSFWFRRSSDFIRYAEEMVREESRINGEFYIDQCMNYLIRAGLGVHVFEVERYVSWGTPDDLRVHEYWESFFKKAWFHPYGK